MCTPAAHQAASFCPADDFPCRTRAAQDPNFDLLLAAIFGDVEAFEQRMLEPSAEVLERAKAVGQQIAEVRCIRVFLWGLWGLCPLHSQL